MLFLNNKTIYMYTLYIKLLVRLTSYTSIEKNFWYYLNQSIFVLLPPKAKADTATTEVIVSLP